VYASTRRGRYSRVCVVSRSSPRYSTGSVPSRNRESSQTNDSGIVRQRRARSIR
jgi:hypothetical protein